MLDQVKGMWITLKHFFRAPITYQYPKERRVMKPRFRGAVVFVPDPETGREKCVGCGLCARVCPSYVITMGLLNEDQYVPRFLREDHKVQVETAPQGAQTTANGQHYYRHYDEDTQKEVDFYYNFNIARCLYCGLCVDACPVKALAMSHHYELAEFQREKLIYDKKDLLELGKKFLAEEGQEKQVKGKVA